MFAFEASCTLTASTRTAGQAVGTIRRKLNWTAGQAVGTSKVSLVPAVPRIKLENNNGIPEPAKEAHKTLSSIP